MLQIIIRHISGHRATEIDCIPLHQHRELVFGRAESAAIRFHPRDDLRVGRFHARLIPLDPPGGYLLTDLDSRNGTYLNGARIWASTLIQPGDVLQFGSGGPEVEFQVEACVEGE